MHHQSKATNNAKEYLKFAGIMLGVAIFSYLFNAWLGDDTHSALMQLMASFMGVFFIVFASFKLVNLKVFAYGFQNYDLIAKRSIVYAFAYPFLQFAFGLLYLFGFGASLVLNPVVLVVSVISGAGVLSSLLRKQQVHCVCLGNVIKLPLSRVSFVEDIGMAVMAIAMILIP